MCVLRLACPLPSVCFTLASLLHRLPDKIERGMIVRFDGEKCGFVENCFNVLDEFWLCDEQSGSTIFDVRDGAAGAVRVFKAAELSFTGAWSQNKKALHDDDDDVT